jgi:hypothetical protein
MKPPEPPTPVRYGSRYGSPPPPDARACPLCATPLPSPRARYCSEACKQRAYRLRQAERRALDPSTLARELKRLRTLVAHTLYECPTCGERYLGVQRCPECQHFCRALGLGGACPHCDEVLLITDVLA